jgi:hypothetical protein
MHSLPEILSILSHAEGTVATSARSFHRAQSPLTLLKPLIRYRRPQDSHPQRIQYRVRGIANIKHQAQLAPQSALMTITWRADESLCVNVALISRSSAQHLRRQSLASPAWRRRARRGCSRSDGCPTDKTNREFSRLNVSLSPPISAPYTCSRKIQSHSIRSCSSQSSRLESRKRLTVAPSVHLCA